MLKHMPKNALKVIENDLLYSKKKVVLPDDKDRRDEGTAAGEDADDRTDKNLNQRIAKFQNQLKNTYETNMQKLFESKTN